jgi:hypothetical protein
MDKKRVDQGTEAKVGPDGVLRKTTAKEKAEWWGIAQVYITGTGEELFSPHPKSPGCKKHDCVVHSPSRHAMRSFPTHWRSDRQLMERICEHGVGHPDPDQISYLRRAYGAAVAATESAHGCDGCCGLLPPGAREATDEELKTYAAKEAQ